MIWSPRSGSRVISWYRDQTEPIYQPHLRQHIWLLGFKPLWYSIKQQLIFIHNSVCISEVAYYNTLMITRTTRTPAFWWYPPPPHDYTYYWVILDPKSNGDKVKVTNLKNSPKFHFSNYANMKWIPQALLQIQSGQDSVHRETDGHTERWTRCNQYTSL